LTGLVSAAVSQYPNVALLKVLSFFLLFIYAATGVRVAAIGREKNFFNGLLVGCEIFVAANAVFYAMGVEAMGNPNSLGAVMGGVAAPILLWGILLGGKPAVHRRRVALYVICVCLLFISHARAGIAAGILASAVLCIASRRYKVLFQGVTVLVIVLAAVALLKPQAISSFTSSVVYKNNAADILASRISPWQTAMDNIRDHPWFGMGLGTTAAGSDADEEQGAFSSSGSVTAEHGSSYLAILAGVGIIGAVPVAILLLLLITKVVRTLWTMHDSESVSHPAIVLAVVMIAGIVHATFEDWMFAPGNYLCVFFWSLAFLFNDLVSSLPRVNFNWHVRTLNGVTASRL
jgi:O-antigen ligase